MYEMLTRGFANLLARNSGPMHARIYIQPLMATILAIRAGWPEAWAGRAIGLGALLHEPAVRRAVLKNLWRIAGRVFLLAVVLDVVYQLIVVHWIYPLETLATATLLALVPCLIVRAIGTCFVALISRYRRRATLEATVHPVPSGPPARSPEVPVETR